MKSVIFILILFPVFAFAQLSENFSDGDFTENPAWSGDIERFIVNSSQLLQLNTSGEGTSYLSTPVDLEGLIEWRLWVRLNFSPSDNNNARIYLVADQQNLKEPLNGYFLKLGEGGSADAIELYRQSGTAEYLITRGTNGLIATSFAISIRVVRTEDGEWSVFADPSGGEDYQPQGAGEDQVWQIYTHFGFFCKYTSSNATRFYFDDIYAGSPIVDQTPPQLLSVEVLDQNRIDLYFSESVDEASATNTLNYFADQGIGAPMAAGRDMTQKSLVHLMFGTAFNEGTLYNLTVSNVKDLAGNAIETVTRPFAYYTVQPYDVVISEIMADPDPPVGLPNFEYLELYNRSDLPIQLENWVLSIGSTKRTLPRKVIEPKSFLILTSDDAVPQLQPFGDVFGFSSISLSNTGATFVLREKTGAVVHHVSYTDGWYRDAVKKNGGWSLEMIDPGNPCGASENWRASINPAGGTPGTVNSVNASNPDNSVPSIEKISITGPSSVRVFFTEPMDSLRLVSPAIYLVDQGVGTPLAVNLYPPAYRSVGLSFDHVFEEGIIYSLEVTAGITDCAGNETTTTLNARFAFPSLPDSADVIINEVLSDPRSTGTEFVEIYNRSQKVIDLKSIWLATRNKTTGELTSVNETAPDGRLMFPGEYLVLTKNPDLVKAEYFTPNPGGFAGMSSFPSYANDLGTVVLLTPWEIILDEFTYNSSMHFALLNTTDGVSLERVNFDRPATEPGNWHSAAQNVGFATPAYQNSQFMKAPESGNEVLISPEIFSPDNDGYNDQLSIVCNFAEPGYAVTIRIFDSNGRPVRLLVKNEPAGTGNQFMWDGITDKREKAPIGIYIIHVEVFNLGGKVKQIRKTAVLGGKL
ncbi:MAG: lamin tail domain-containing protein [Lentimicrobium sp.]